MRGAEAGIPAPLLHSVARQVARVLRRRAEAGRADEGAVGAAEATGRDVVPARVLEVPEEHVADVGRHLKRAGQSYDDFVGSLEARVLVSARKFRDLGVTPAKELPDDMPPAQVEVREPRSPEFAIVDLGLQNDR